jgi:hypothetical protein
MLEALQIAIGIWLGGLFLIGTVGAALHVQDRIKRNLRYGAPWYRLVGR